MFPFEGRSIEASPRVSRLFKNAHGRKRPMSNERYRESVLLRMLRRRPVPTRDALYFRNWPVTPEDAMLSLEEIALRILSEVEERP
jgi:hypothetical protein